MTQNKKIAITGGVGSGKSSAAAALKELGYPVFSCDTIYREMTGERDFLDRLSALFPGCVSGGALDRAALSRVVFSDASARERLDALAHPMIMERLMSLMRPYPLSFAEVPLLYEGGFAHLFDGVISLVRDRGERIAAICARDKISAEEAALRMAAQRDWENVPSGCFILKNNGTQDDLKRGLKEILKRLGEDPPKAV